MSVRKFAGTLLACLGAVASPAGAETIAIVGARLYTMTADAPMEAGTIILQEGRILAVGVDLTVPEGARRIDGRGRVVTPAFLNSATQLGLTEVSSVRTSNDQAVSDGALGAAFDIQYALNPASLAIRQAAADGLGRAVSFPASSARSPFAGFGALLRLAGDPLLEQSRLAMFADVGGQSSGRAGGSRSAQWQIMRAALDESRTLRTGTRPGQPRDSAFGLGDLVALRGVIDGSVPLVIDVNRESDIRQAIALARDYRIRVIVKGGLEAWRVADELAAARIPVVLDPSVNLPLYFDEVGVRADAATRLHRAGVLVAFRVNLSVHATYNAGYALREVAGLAAANGMDRGAALAAITRNPARIWGVDSRCGALAAGLDADVVVWDGDPLEPLTSVITVILHGREVTQDTRQDELRERYRPQALPPSLPPAYRNP